MNKKNGVVFSVLLALLLSACEDRPKTLAGGALGGVVGGAGAAVIARSMGASSGLAGTFGLLGAAAGAVTGAHVGSVLDARARQKVRHVAHTNSPMAFMDDSGDEWVALPSRNTTPTGEAVRVRVINQKTGKEVIVDTK